MCLFHRAMIKDQSVKQQSQSTCKHHTIEKENEHALTDSTQPRAEDRESENGNRNIGHRNQKMAMLQLD